MDAPPRAATPQRPTDSASPRGITPQRPPASSRANTPPREGSPKTRAAAQKKEKKAGKGILSFKCGAPQVREEPEKKGAVPGPEIGLEPEQELRTPERRVVREQAGLAMSPTPEEHQDGLAQLAAQHDLRTYTQLSGLHKKMDTIINVVNQKGGGGGGGGGSGGGGGGGGGDWHPREMQNAEREHSRLIERVSSEHVLVFPART